MARGTATRGLVFFVLGLCLHAAFSVERTAYDALAVFGLWFGPATLLLQPLGNAPSRRHEFAADASRCGTARARPSWGTRSGSSERRAGSSRPPTRSTRTSTTRTRRSSSGCPRWGGSHPGDQTQDSI